MKAEAQRIAIAEVCGWDTGECKAGYGVPWIDGIKGDEEEKLPDYFKDLNACHEMEKYLEDGEQRCLYYEELCRLANECDGHWSNAIFATAAQRCEAFLKTLGLWVESDEKEGKV